MQLTQLQVNKIAEIFQQQPVMKAYVFGSFSRGEATTESDLDLLVELAGDTDLFAFIQMKLDLEASLHRSVDLISTKGVSPHLSPFIEKDKVLIYER